jgi:hypothetical protein
MDRITSITTIAGSAITVATFANAVWQYRRKVHLEIFRTYADRYNAVITSDIYGKWLAALKGNQDYWIDLTPTMINYLNLIWEEFFLLRDGVIHRRLWRLWLPEIRRVLSSEFAWTVLRTYDFHFPPELTCGSSAYDELPTDTKLEK